MRILVLKLSAIVALCALPMGCTNTQRQSTLKAALITADVSRDAFVAYDASAQTTIVNESKSLEDGKAKLAAYRAAREKVVVVFSSTYHAIASAAIANDDQSMTGLAAALTQLYLALKPYINVGGAQ